MVRELIEAAGERADEAACIAEAVRRPGPTFEAAITEHIDLLSGVGADTRSHYRGQLRSHIAPALGALPVFAVTYRHVAGWVRAMTDGPVPPRRSPTCTGCCPQRCRRRCGSATGPTTRVSASSCRSWWRLATR